MSAIFLLPGRLTYWPRKYTTRVNPHEDNSHQVWSWYDHQLPSYSVLSADVTWPWPLTFWPWTCHTWRVTWPTLPPSMKTICLFVLELSVITFSVGWKCVGPTRLLRMRRITWPVSTGSKTIYIFGMLDPDLPIHYTTFIGLRRRLRVVYSRASPMLKPLTA